MTSCARPEYNFQVPLALKNADTSTFINNLLQKINNSVAK